jgi:hypothetical protein
MAWHSCCRWVEVHRRSFFVIAEDAKQLRRVGDPTGVLWSSSHVSRKENNKT